MPSDTRQSMASSETQICNLALGRMGEDGISSLSENSRAAKLCAVFYESVRDALLCVHDWAFAGARVGPLSPLTDVPAFGYAYAFQLPSDCLQIRGLYGVTSSTAWQVEGRQLLTDLDTISLLYTKQVSDPTAFHPLFTNALSMRLAYTVAYALAPSGDLAKMLFQLYGVALDEARRGNNRATNWQQTPSDDAWVMGR